MFILYPVAIGLVLGLLLGGRLDGLAVLRIRWAPAILFSLLAQIVLFSEPVAARVGDLGPALYVGSTALVLVAVIRNGAIPGIPIVAAGAASNLLAIVTNGGYMPAGQSALAALGALDPTVYSNSAVMPDPALAPLTDIFALPGWVPGANIFSMGDVLIGIGIAAVVVIAMRAGATAGHAADEGDGAADGADGHDVRAAGRAAPPAGDPPVPVRTGPQS
jgi:Family of unknown function (DUF5317)